MKTLFTTILLLGALLLPASKTFRNAAVQGLTTVASVAERYILRGDYSEIRFVEEDEFEDVIREPGRLVVVVFHKELAASSRSKTQRLDKLMKQLPSKVLIAKITSESSAALMERLNISDVPTIRVYRDGVLLREFSGAISSTEFKAYIDARLEEKVTPGGMPVEMKPMNEDWLPPGVEKE